MPDLKHTRDIADCKAGLLVTIPTAPARQNAQSVKTREIVLARPYRHASRIPATMQRFNDVPSWTTRPSCLSFNVKADYMMQRSLRSLLKTVTQVSALSAILLMPATCQAPDSPLETLPKGETGRVVRIIDGDALVLDTGLTVRLVGIQAPAPEQRNRVGEPYADKSTRMLEDLSMGRQVRLFYPGITRDRYDRALAYVRTDDNLGAEIWLNHQLLKHGAARARLYPDTSRLGEYLLAAESRARNERRGLWALSAYDVLAANDITSDTLGFTIVTGVAGPIMQSTNERSICERTLRNADLVLHILAGARELCRSDDNTLPRRFRGYIKDGTLEITHMLNAEPVSQNEAPPKNLLLP